MPKIYLADNLDPKTIIKTKFSLKPHTIYKYTKQRFNADQI